MDGGQSLPPIRRQLAQALIESGAKSLHVAKEVKCSLATVYNYKENIRLFGHTLTPSISRDRPASCFYSGNARCMSLYPFILLTS